MCDPTVNLRKFFNPDFISKTYITVFLLVFCRAHSAAAGYLELELRRNINTKWRHHPEFDSQHAKFYSL